MTIFKHYFPIYFEMLSVGIICDYNEYKCSGESKCINKILLCDGDDDCDLGDDEAMCTGSKFHELNV